MESEEESGSDSSDMNVDGVGFNRSSRIRRLRRRLLDDLYESDDGWVDLDDDSDDSDDMDDDDDDDDEEMEVENDDEDNSSMFDEEL